MSLRSEMQPYIDGNGLVSPGPVESGTLSASNNGVMYTSEYYIMLLMCKETESWDRLAFFVFISLCIDENGMLNRKPVSQKSDQEGPDDYYGVINACKRYQITVLPRRFLKALIKYKGFLNNVNPGTMTKSSFLARQPQLVCAMISAAYPSFKHPGHWLIRILAFPLYLITAVIIATSCMFANKNDSDARRNAWHLIGAVTPVSFLCKVASLLWFERLYNTYGMLGMRAVAALYYSPEHPFIKYWKTE